MQLLTETRNATSHRRGRLPALLAAGILFLFVLTACHVAVADDGSIHIQPESTSTAAVNNPQTGAGNGTAGNTLAGFITQPGQLELEADPIDPNQTYEWNGQIEWVEIEGGHFIVDRGCDNWAVIPEHDELYEMLKMLHGERATVWGTVNLAKNTYGRHTINATSVHRPGEIQTLVEVPQIPCPTVPPVPGDHIAVNHSEVTLHGELVWRADRLWIVTPRGNVLLQLPVVAKDMFPDFDLPQLPEADDAHSAADRAFSLGEYGVVGMWELTNAGLSVRVREVQEWPHRTFVRNHCGGGFHHFVVGDEQVAVHGTLVITDGQWVLRTKSGVVYIHRNVAGDGLVNPETGDVTDVRPEILSTHDVVVIGDWKTDGSELHMEADNFVRVKTDCEPPLPPRPPILPGEIAALGTLMFVNGQPFLNTPSGRIVLFRPNDIPDGEPQRADPSLFTDVAPEVIEEDGVVIHTDGGFVGPEHADRDVVRPVRQILVVGKWFLHREQLAIAVRYALPWPHAHRQMVDGEPMQGKAIFELPTPEPIEPPFNFQVDPVSTDDIDVIDPESDQSQIRKAERSEVTNFRAVIVAGS